MHAKRAKNIEECRIEYLYASHKSAMSVVCSSFISSRTSAHYVSHTQTLHSSLQRRQEALRIYLLRVPGAGGEGLE